VNNTVKGKLIKWDSKKGFGFIRPSEETENIFIHISDFKDKNYRPTVGDIILYKIGQGKNNKEKAVYAYAEISDNNFVKKNHIKNKSKNYFLKKELLLILFIGIVFIYNNYSKEKNVSINNESKENNIQKEKKIVKYKNSIEDKEFDEFLREQDNIIKEHSNNNNKKYIEKNVPKENMQKLVTRYKRKEHIKKQQTSSKKYRCDGRQHCSQMKSCSEAKYFIRHCPRTKMDGDGDGIPCERQWCR